MGNSTARFPTRVRKTVVIISLAFVLVFSTFTYYLPIQVYASHSTFQEGDVLVGAADSKVAWYHPDGTLNTVLDAGFAPKAVQGMGFDNSGRLFVLLTTGSVLDEEVVKIFNADGTLVDGTFGGPYHASISVSFDAAGNVFFGQVDPPGDILKFDSAGNLLDSFAVEGGSSPFIDLAADQCTMYFSGQNSNKISKHNVCVDSALPDLVTDPIGIILNLRLLPDGRILVINDQGTEMSLLDSSGDVIMTYDIGIGDSWVAISLDPDGASFWAAEDGGTFYKFEIATGDVLLGPIVQRSPFLRTLAVAGEIRAATHGDTIPPDTKMSKPTDGNLELIRNGGFTVSTSMTFTFRGIDNSGIAGFECRLDSAPEFTPCASPMTYHDLDAYSPDPFVSGKHEFRVRAVDTSGNEDPTPTVWRWVVLNPAQGVNKLIKWINGFPDVEQDVKEDLLEPLKGLIKKLNDGNEENNTIVCRNLDEFIEEVNEAEEDGDLTAEQATRLRNMANAVSNAIDC